MVPMVLGGADENTGWYGSVAAQNSESKKEEFRKYLERAGVIDALTKGRQLPRPARPRPRHQLAGQRALLRALAGWRAAPSGRSDVLGACSAGGALRDQREAGQCAGVSPIASHAVATAGRGRGSAVGSVVPGMVTDGPVRSVAPCSFIKQYLNASNADEVEHLKAELETVKQEKAQLEKELAELKVRSSPRLLSVCARARVRSTALCSMDTSPGRAKTSRCCVL